MTDCPDATLLAAYLEGTCDDLTAERLERHAARCDTCFAELEAVTRVPAVMALLMTLPPPAHTRAAVLRDVAARRGRRRALRWGGVLAAGLVLAMIGSVARKEASTRPPLGPPLSLRVVESAVGVHQVHVTQALGTLTVEGIDGVSDITWSGTRDDLTEVTVRRVADTLALAVVPRDGASWPAEAQGTLVVPSSMRVVVIGRDLVVRDRGGTGGITIRGRADRQSVNGAP